MILFPTHAAYAAEGLAPVAVVAASGSTSPLVVFGIGLVAGLLCGPLYARLGGHARLVAGLQALRARLRRAPVASAVAASPSAPPVDPYRRAPYVSAAPPVAEQEKVIRPVMPTSPTAGRITL